MTADQRLAGANSKPGLLFFYSARDGRARRVEGYIAQVLQHRRNHDTFVVHNIEVSARPDLRERFRVDGELTLIVVHGRATRARLDRPRNAKMITEFLEPWLR